VLRILANVVYFCLFVLGEVPSTLNQRMDGKTVYVNKATRTENSAMDHATKQRPHVFELFVMTKFLLLCNVMECV